MNQLTLTCEDDRRRQMVRDKGLNGLDYVEVIDDHDQRTLCVHFFGQAPEQIEKASVIIKGGRRVRNIRVLEVEIERQSDPELDDCLRVTVDKPGDFSTYQLCLVELDKQGRPTHKPLQGFDPRYACVDFSFKVGCPSDLDCKIEPVCPPQPLVEPEVNYLAKDYASFRQLILDRLALIMPDWQERHVPDVGVALIEVLAYAGDTLSYYQDAVATEAYLETARQRISVRRHARLVDYQLHEGCNARTWVHVQAGSDVPLNPDDIYFITGCDELAQATSQVLSERDLINIPPSHYQVFEPLVKRPAQPIQLYAAHSTINFYTWGDEECCLPRGAMQATLRDAWADAPTPPTPTSLQQTQTPPTPSQTRQRKLRLKVGDVLILEEVIGPKTGDPADADPTHRCAVRLTKVEPGEDALYDPPIPIIEIEWAVEDALPFPLCLSATLPAPDCTLIDNISVARGNVILVDHGKTTGEPLGTVPTQETIGECECEGSVVETTYVPGKFRPVLQQGPVTFSQPLNLRAPASKQLAQDPRSALPWVTLTGLPAATGEPIHPDDLKWKWHPQRDLLNSRSQDQDFVVEVDDDGRAHLRFGDGDLGKMPAAGTTFTASYRVGNGPPGNVGAETLTFLITQQTTLSGFNLQPRNPLPAQGGTAPEPLAEVKLFAPFAFRKVLERAITADDYARIGERNPQVQRAAAALSWTGSWYEARVAIDPLGTEEASDTLLDQVEHTLYRFRRMGHDLVVAPASYAPLDLELTVCVLPHYLRGHVEAAILDRLSNRRLPNGELGFFAPDNLSFGEGVAVSAIVAAVQAVTGVASVTVKFKRWDDRPNQAIDDGVLKFGPMEIAQLDNDPSFPERGKLTLIMEGGR